MRPTLKVTVKSDGWRLSWCYAVSGWDTSKCCLAALAGRHVPELRWTRPADRPPPGTVTTVRLDPLGDASYWHLCIVGESYEANAHVCFRPSPGRGFFAVENRYMRIEGRGLEELVIPDPGWTFWRSGLSFQAKRCRCVIAAWGLLPERPELPLSRYR